MKVTYLVLIASLSFNTNAKDSDWIEADWMYDALTTSSVKSGMTIDVSTGSDGTPWTFENGMLTARSCGVESTTPYYVHRKDDERLELIIDGAAMYVFEVWQTENGFCAKLPSVWLDEIQIWSKPHLKCFVPNDE